MALRFQQRRRMRAASSAGTGLILLTAACGGCSGIGSQGDGGKPIVGLITKTNDNPYYVKMREGAEKRAEELGLELRTAAGSGQTDNDSQVKAIENLVAAGAKGILITPSDSSSVLPAIERAREAGVMVVALDSPTDPVSAADATYSTDNRQAGRLIGQWAKAKMAGKKTRAAFLDLSADQVKVDVLRSQGFMEGFGIDEGDPDRIGDEKDPRIVGHEVTGANEEGGREAMEKLLQRAPSINLVYTINEPAAAGAHQAIKAAGKQKDITVVSIDGGCPGVKQVTAGAIGATSMQFPVKMAADGVRAVADYAKDGSKPSASPGRDFINTGTTLITDDPVPGVDSQKSDWGKAHCWG